MAENGSHGSTSPEGDSGARLRDRLAGPSPSWGELRASTDHADKAYEFLNSSAFNGEPEVTKAMIAAAEVHAKLAIHDKIEELAQTIRACTHNLLDAQAKLDAHIQTAAQFLHKDAHELKAQLRVINGEKAA